MNATATVAAEARTCYCGCGKTVGKKSIFAPGHDARYIGVAARTLVDSDDPEVGPALIKARSKEISADLSQALALKFEKMATGLLAKKQAKAEKKATRLASRKAEAKGLKGQAVKVKVGRWTKDGIIEAVAGGKPAVIVVADSKGKVTRINVTSKTEWSLA